MFIAKQILDDKNIIILLFTVAYSSIYCRLMKCYPLEVINGTATVDRQVIIGGRNQCNSVLGNKIFPVTVCKLGVS